MAEGSESALATADPAHPGELFDSATLEAIREIVAAATYWSDFARSASAVAAKADRNFGLNNKERKRLERAQQMFPDPTYWDRLAVAVHPFIFQAYIDRDITLPQLIEITNSTALGCSTILRLMMLGVVAASSRDVVRKSPHNRRPPQYPLALKRVAVAVAITLKELVPELPLNSEEGDSVLATTVEWIGVTGLFAKAPSRKTLHEWYLARQRESGSASPRGRPRKL